EQLGHLANEDVAAPLHLHELERARESAVRPSRDRRHARGIARVRRRRWTAGGIAGRSATRVGSGSRSSATAAATTTSAWAATRRLRDRREVDAQLLCLPLHVRIERRGGLDA